MFRQANCLRVLVATTFLIAGPLLAAPIHDAAKAGNVDEVKQLLDSGARIDARNKYGYTPLFIAAFEGHLDLAKFLVSEGADIEARAEGGRTPLAVAAFDDRFEVVQYLISVGANVHARTEKGETPLQWVARKGSLATAELLISNGAEINARDNEGNMPLHWAAELCRKNMAELLLAHGAQINAHRRKRGSDRLEGRMPLHLAISGAIDPNPARKKACISVARFLIDEGADISGRGDSGDMPLHVAASWGVLEIVEVLISSGADVNAVNDDGRTPLMEAAFLDQVAAAELLITAGANVNAKTQSGVTALHDAARNGQVAVAEILIDAGAVVNAQDGEGNTPLDLVPATKRNMRKLLEEHGAKGVRTAISCVSAQNIEQINRGGITRIMDVKGSNALIYMTLDPLWSYPEFPPQVRRDEHYAASVREAREALAEAEIDQVIVWRLQIKAMGVAMPFKDGCVVSGFGGPDRMDKLMLMNKTLGFIAKYGLDDSRVRRSIGDLLKASPWAGRYQDEIVDVMIERLRPLVSNTAGSQDEIEGRQNEECRPPTYSDIRDGYKCAR